MCYVPFPTLESAQKVTTYLLEKKLIACANIVTSESIYSWNGDYQHENEWIAIIKTSQSNRQILVEAVESQHPYDLPAILCWEVETNSSYGVWVNDQVTN